MDPQFWHERWRNNEIGFHQDAINVHLQRAWPALGLAAATRIFVPLCGKSRDMLWLAAQGHKVVGVEISPVAASAFFAENSLVASREAAPPFTRWQSGEVTLFEGDFFQLDAERLAPVQGVYDRASLVALPPAMRPRYAQHMARLLATGTPVLLVAFDYPADEMNGPPFCVPHSEVDALFSPYFDIELCYSEDVLEANPRFRERGLTRISEEVYRLVRR